MKKAVVGGAGGFIGGHLVERLKKEGFWVRGVDIKQHDFRKTAADEFLQLDLRKPESCVQAVLVDGQPADEELPRTRLREDSIPVSIGQPVEPVERVESAESRVAKGSES